MRHNRNTYSILALIFFLFFVKSKAQISSKDISRAIDLNSIDHPYLYFNESSKGSMVTDENQNEYKV